VRHDKPDADAECSHCMPLELWNTIATTGTMLVISVTAIAAFIQLRHMRGGNQISAMTELRERLESPEYQDALRFVVEELPKRMTDPNLKTELRKNPFVGEYRAIGAVANVHEAIGLFVRRGVIDKHSACSLWGWQAKTGWDALAPIVAFVRENDKSDAIWENFEYIAVLSNQFIDRYPNGEYPKGTPRMPVDRSLLNGSTATHSTNRAPDSDRVL